MEKKEKIYPKGIRTFAAHQNAPEFVKGTVIITPNELFTFCKENPELMSEYNGQKQLKCNLLEGRNGYYLTVDTFKPVPKTEKNDLPESESKGDDLPF